VIVNIGMGEASQNVKLLDVAGHQLGQITGQKPVVTRAKKSIAISRFAAECRSAAGHFAWRSHVPNFWTACATCASARCAISGACRPNAFDGRGNYTLGLRDQLVFPEIDYTRRSTRLKGMNITYGPRQERRRRPRTAEALACRCGRRLKRVRALLGARRIKIGWRVYFYAERFK